jgi:P-type Ca2+ transporter type 2C
VVWLGLALIGLLVGGVTLGAFLAGRGLDGDAAQTMAFTTLALCELALVFAIRSPHEPAWRAPQNRPLVWSVLLSATLVAALVYAPAAHGAFATVSLDALEAFVALGLALLPLLVLEIAKAVLGRRLARRQPAAVTPAIERPVVGARS